jgi:hypothetical protein
VNYWREPPQRPGQTPIATRPRRASRGACTRSWPGGPDYKRSTGGSPGMDWIDSRDRKVASLMSLPIGVAIHTHTRWRAVATRLAFWLNEPARLAAHDGCTARASLLPPDGPSGRDHPPSTANCPSRRDGTSKPDSATLAQRSPRLMPDSHMRAVACRAHGWASLRHGGLFVAGQVSGGK